jgi:hypothetical protein
MENWGLQRAKTDAPLLNCARWILSRQTAGSQAYRSNAAVVVLEMTGDVPPRPRGDTTGDGFATFPIRSFLVGTMKRSYGTRAPHAPPFPV